MSRASRPGFNQVYAETKDIEKLATADFVFQVEDDGFIWRGVDVEIDQQTLQKLATVPFRVTDVIRRGAGEAKDSHMNQGDIPLALFCKSGNPDRTFYYEEPISGRGKIKIKVSNLDAEFKHEVTIVLWGASFKEDPEYLPPEKWPDVTPWKVKEVDRTKGRNEAVGEQP